MKRRSVENVVKLSTKLPLQNPNLKIAVIGSGVSGIVSSYLLNKKYEVTLFEKNDYVGGHTNTIVIDSGEDAGTSVDTGFIVLNDKNYPTFEKFLEIIGIKTQPSVMSFSFHDEISHLQYSSDLPKGLFAQRRNLFNPRFLVMLSDILRFNKESIRDYHHGLLKTRTLGDYFKRKKYSAQFVHNYVIPMGAAIWSTKPNEMLDFPAATFIRFFENHGLLTLKNRPNWKTVVGGSHAYVKAFLKEFKGKIELKAQISRVIRERDKIILRMNHGASYEFDKVVFATHADEVLPLLEKPTELEKKLLGVWFYQKNLAVLHTDESVMPPNSRAWASWNYVRERNFDGDHPVSVTYYMNLLQSLKAQRKYFVSLNRRKPIVKDRIIREIHYTHPSYTFQSIHAQNELSKLNGVQNTYFCGSYFGYGFHEDAVKSAVQVAGHFGINL